MNKTFERETLTDALYDMGLDEDAIYENYSGRGMYGDTCFGITASEGEMFRLFARLGYYEGRDDKDDDAEALASSARSDSMGLGTIWYFPGWTLTDTEDEPDEPATWVDPETAKNLKEGS